MKSKFIADGAWRFARGKDSAARESIQARYAGEMAAAGPIHKLRIRYRMWRDFLRERKRGHEPSSKSLF